jgi:hypothetical protein
VTAAVLAVWVWGNISAGQYVPLGHAEAGLLGAVHGGKALQTRFELGSSGGYGIPGVPGRPRKPEEDEGGEI